MSIKSFSRKQLIKMCEQTIKPLHEWESVDEGYQHRLTGICWALLKAEHPFTVMTDKDFSMMYVPEEGDDWEPNNNIIWVVFKKVDLYGNGPEDEHFPFTFK